MASAFRGRAGLGLSQAALVLASLLFVGLAERLPAGFDPETILDDGVGRIYLPPDGVRDAGGTLASARDVLDDGKDALLVGASSQEGPGIVYVVPATEGGSTIRTLRPGQDGVIEVRSGSLFADGLGQSVAGAGDVDGDGVGDFLIAMPMPALPQFQSGGVFLVFGSRRLPESLDLGEELGSQAVFLSTEATPAFHGISCSGAGDLNGDGIADIVIGLATAGGQGNGGPRVAGGKAWIVFGSGGLRSGPSIRSLDSLSPPAGLEIDGVEGESDFGASVRGVGDLDGDGFDDVALGAPGQGAGGSVFVVFGRRDFSASPDLSAPDGNSLVELEAAIGGIRLGEAIDGGLDATGDRQPDLLLGAPGLQREGFRAGAAFLLDGSALRGTPRQIVPNVSAVKIRGILGSGTGEALSLVPDADGDGADDLLLGAPGLKGGRGAAYLVRGGREPGQEIFLEQLAPPDGWVFFVSAMGIRLGDAVAGLKDRNGDLLGDFAIGAPGARDEHGYPGMGAVFELFFEPDPESPAPRDLKVELLAGGKVQLTWMIGERYRFIRVYRDGAQISPDLPGDLMRFLDVAPGRGRHVYQVEAEGDPALRSEQKEVEVRGVKVRHLSCRQIEGSRDVFVAWVPRDYYEALQVCVDGEPASPLLSPELDHYELEDLSRGQHLIEVYDPVAVPEGERAACTIDVRGSPESLPEIKGFTCEAEHPRNVRLRWAVDPQYDGYLIERNEIHVAFVEDAGEFLDTGVPTGPAEYRIRGIHAWIHRGPASACSVEVSSPGDLVVAGRVVWSGGAAVGRGRVRVYDLGGKPEADVQVSKSGEFRASVSAPGTYRASFEISFDATRLPFEVARAQTLGVTASASASTGQEARIELPLPVLLLSPLGSEGSEASAAARWDVLRSSMESRALALPVVVPGGIAGGVALLSIRVEELLGFLKEDLGSSPPSLDVVAHGAAGLTVRAFVASRPPRTIRRLVLLGTPNLGTPRAEVEARAEASLWPLRLAAGAEDPPGNGTQVETPLFSGALEQTPAFLSDFNGKVRETRGAEVHLVAGTGGIRLLDPVLGATRHDDRVAEDSALGGVPGSVPHRVDESHEGLGRLPESVALIETILGLEGEGAGGQGAGAAGEGGGLPAVDLPAPQEVAARGVGAAETSYSPGNTYVGLLGPGETGDLPLVSDTSESIIIILNSDLPGGIVFRVVTPLGTTVEPAGVGALPNVEYQTYGDGEGHVIQGFRFSPCEVGTYRAQLENADGNVAVRYTLEAFVASDIGLTVAVEPEDVPPGEGTVVRAQVTRKGLPELQAVVEARITRPDGAMAVLDLLDDGHGADAVPSDGVYSAAISPSDQPGIHQVEVSALEESPLLSEFHREAITWYRVWSDVAKFTGDFTSGTDDSTGDGVADTLWVDVGVTTKDAGLFLASGELTDLSGNPVASTGTVFSLPKASETTFRLSFAGADLLAARRDGPFVLASVVLYDGSAGFVPSDYSANAHTTAAIGWHVFGESPVPMFLRGDANEDGVVDISDGILILSSLFLGDQRIDCADAADSNADGSIDIADASSIFLYLFAGGQRISAPFPDCGAAELLGCSHHAACLP